jgi:hypothetical protein
MPMGELDLLVRAAINYRVPLNAVSNRTFVQLMRGGGVSSDINRVLVINRSCDICGEKKENTGSQHYLDRMQSYANWRAEKKGFENASVT